MRIVSRSLILFCFINLVRGQSSESEDSESEVLGDSKWWSERITKINRKQPIGVDSEDSERHQSHRWKDEETEEPRKRPRPLGSTLRPPETRDRFESQREDFINSEENRGVEERQNRRWEEDETEEHQKRPHPLTSILRPPDIRDRFESQRENFRNIEESSVVREVFNWQRPSPSPILLPPYAFSSTSPLYQKSIFDINDVQSPWKNESLHAGKSSGSSAVDRIRIYEITTVNSSSNEKVESKPSYDDDSSKILDRNIENRWVDIVRKSSVNVTKRRNQQNIDRDGQNLPRSFYIDEDPVNKRAKSLHFTLSRINNSIKNPRGNRKYQHDFESEKNFVRKQTFSSTSKYDWQQHPAEQRTNHFKLNSNFKPKIGAVPGIPGRDYPVHQEHTHHNLRNVADRFPCPQTPKTHVYLADRASRCQIFYVCYGSKTGVPMVCPNGTLFSEPLQVCDWWFNVSC